MVKNGFIESPSILAYSLLRVPRRSSTSLTDLGNTFELIKVPSDIYEIAFVPFRIRFYDLLFIIIITLLISFLSTLFPAHRASKVDPVKALKYE